MDAVPASSSRVYLMKSALRTRMRMVARNPVSSNTVTQEFTMLNQWIYRCNIISAGTQANQNNRVLASDSASKAG